MIASYYMLKHGLKIARWKYRRWHMSRKWGKELLESSPRVFGNAMPKSGSHLLTQVLHGLTQLGPFVDPGFPPVNRDEANKPLAEEIVLKNIQSMRPGDIRYGYIHARQPFLDVLSGSGYATIFIYRDPRDMLVSHVFYATDMNPAHGMHRYYKETLTTMEQRLNAAIRGVDEPGFELASVADRYASYIGWLSQPSVLSIRFEDLILNQREALAKIVAYLQTRGWNTQGLRQDNALDVLQQAIQPRKSGTFRKGQPGNWREYFTEQNKALFKEVAGDLLIRLGYENDNDW